MEYERAASIQHGTEAAICFWEKGGFNQTGFIFECKKFHGVAMFGVHNFAGNQQTGNAYMFSNKAG
jgi:hypothetical protein